MCGCGCVVCGWVVRRCVGVGVCLGVSATAVLYIRNLVSYTSQKKSVHIVKLLTIIFI